MSKKTEERAQPGRRLQGDAGRQRLGFVRGVAEEQQRDVAGARIAVRPDLADVERVVPLPRAQERHHGRAVPQREGDGRHFLGLERVGELRVAELEFLLRALLSGHRSSVDARPSPLIPPTDRGPSRAGARAG
jgi:hypothetical protein